MGRPNRRGIVVVLLILGAVLWLTKPWASQYAVAPPNDLTALTAEQWQADLRFLVATIPKRHPNAFFAVDRVEFERAASQLEIDLRELDTAAIGVRLTQLLAMLGDSHTGINALSGNPRILPLQFTWLSDGLFVTAAQPGQQAALGARVVRIGTLSVEDAYQAVATLIAGDNDAWRLAQSEQYLMMASVLQALGVAPAGETVNLGFVAADGREFALDLPLLPGKPGPWLTAEARLPLYRTRANEPFWFEHLAAERTIYIRYNQCTNGDGMQKLSDAVWQLAEQNPIDRLVIDLRGNGGGNSQVLSPVLNGLRQRPALTQQRRVFALIDRGTFSSALMNSIQLRDQANAILIGEPTGGRPNHYGEVRTFRLPNSGLTVFHSTKYFTMQKDDTPSLMPDITVRPSSADYLAGRDPVLEAALAQPTK